jgi:pentatricopeptide repeat protein
MTEKTIEQIDAEMMSVEQRVNSAIDDAFDKAIAESKTQAVKDAEIYEKTVSLTKEANRLKSDKSDVKNTSIFVGTLVDKYVKERKFKEAAEVVDVMKQYKATVLTAKAIKDEELRKFRGW